MDKFLWELFRNTGDLRYYNLLKKVEDSESDENRESKRDNS